MAKKSIKKKSIKPKTKKTKSTFPKGEILMIVVLFASFIIIAVSKCNSKKLEMNDNKQFIQEVVPSDTIVLVESNPVINQKHIIDTSKIVISTPEALSDFSRLFVVMDSLKLRQGPHLDSSIIQRLMIDESVFFMNEITDFTQKITLKSRLFDEPWIKIKTKNGKIGWSYGAGLNFYRRKNKK